jgi:hypothetical protein
MKYLATNQYTRPGCACQAFVALVNTHKSRSSGEGPFAGEGQRGRGASIRCSDPQNLEKETFLKDNTHKVVIDAYAQRDSAIARHLQAL